MLAAARETDPVRVIVVVGHRRREVTDYLAQHAPDAQPVVQHRQGGTGHAVRTVIEEVGLDHGTIVVTCADTPLLRGATLADLVREHQATDAAATVLTARVPHPHGYGRIIRDESGDFLAIIEEADATPDAAGRGRDQLRGLRVRGAPARRRGQAGAHRQRQR